MDLRDKARFQGIAAKAEKSFTESEMYAEFLNKTPQEKMDVLNGRKSKVPTVDYLPNYDEVLEKMADKNQSFLVFSIGTTGLDAQNGCACMQCSFGVVRYDEEKQGFILQQNRVETLVKPVDKDTLDIADISKKNTLYDIFESGGFNREVSEGGLGISEKDYRSACKIDKNTKGYAEALKNISPNFVTPEKFNEKVNIWFDYAMSHNMTVIGVAPDFARPFLRNNADNVYAKNLPDNALDIQELVRCHDYREVTKEQVDENYKGKFISMSGKGYKIEDFSKALNGEENLYSSREKVILVANVLNDLASRNKIIDKPLIADIKSDGIVSYILKENTKEKEAEAPSEERPLITISRVEEPVKEGKAITFTGKETALEDIESAVKNAFDTEKADVTVEVETVEETIKYDNAEVTKDDMKQNEFYGKDGNTTVILDGKEQNIGQKPEKVTHNIPKGDPTVDDIVRQEVAKVIEERYSYIINTIDKIAQSIFAIETEVRELKNPKDKPKTPRKPRQKKVKDITDAIKDVKEETTKLETEATKLETTETTEKTAETTEPEKKQRIRRATKEDKAVIKAENTEPEIEREEKDDGERDDR